MRGKRKTPTVGELKQELAERDETWWVDERLHDEDPLPNYPTGGQSEEDIPAESRLVPLDPDADLAEIIAELPPTNHWLAKTWAEAELLDRAAVEGVQPIETTEFGPS